MKKLQPLNPLKGTLKEQNTNSPPLGGRGASRRTKVLHSSKPFLYPTLKPLAEDMRNHPTPSEAKLWDKLNKKKLGVKFRRQHIIDQFIVDFYSIEAQLVIEIDGKVHDAQQERDAERSIILQSLGLTILRFTNEQVDSSLDKVVSTIIQFLRKPPFGANERSQRNV